jgi:hypothetical protein
MPNPEPTTRTREVYSADLRDYNDFTKNYVLDYKPVTVLSFPSIETAAGPADLASMGTGAAPVSDINTSQIGSMTFATTDTHGFRVELPYDMDVRAACGFRVKWQKIQAIAAGTGACLWTLTYEQKQIGVSTTGAGIAATVLNTIIANQVDLAQFVSQWTSIGIINAGTLNALTAGTDCLDCTLLATLDTITDGTLDAVQLWYRPRLV